MSKVSIQGDPNGTGDFTIKAPNSNNNRQLDLPDEAGTVLTSASDIEPQVKTATNATGSAPIYACRAWVNFDGTGTVSIRDSGNVSSITDNETGVYTVNFATAMPDANYAFAGKSLRIIGLTNYLRDWQAIGTPTSSALQIQVSQLNTADEQDIEVVCIAVFR